MPQLLTAFPLRLCSAEPSEMWHFANRILDGNIEWSTPLWHTSWDTGPICDRHRALLHATTPYGFPIKTMQCWPSEMWPLQIAFSTGMDRVVHSSLAHSWDTGPKHRHRALSHATTLYGFPSDTISSVGGQTIWRFLRYCRTILYALLDMYIIIT